MTGPAGYLGIIIYGKAASMLTNSPAVIALYPAGFIFNHPTINK